MSVSDVLTFFEGWAPLVRVFVGVIVGLEIVAFIPTLFRGWVRG